MNLFNLAAHSNLGRTAERFPVMIPSGFRYRRAERLHLKREVDKVIELGQRAANPCFVLHWCEQSKSASELSSKNIPLRRISIRISRDFGSAPSRNRAKRIVREIFRCEKSRLREGIDMVVKIRPLQNPDQLHLHFLKPRFLELCESAGILVKVGSAAGPQ